MEEKKPITHITAGLILAGVLIIFSEVMMAIQGDEVSGTRSGTQWIVYLVVIGALIYFINQYAKANHNEMSFGNLFAFGFKITAVFSAISVLYMLVFPYIHPEFKQQAIDAARVEMEKQKDFNESKMETAMSILEKYFWVFAIGGSLIGNLVLGCVGSLIGAAVTKKNKRNPMQQIDQLDS